ncbi:16S rRNA (cytosine(967)-C(5))-methyltransferase RsmB [Lacticaseibacillus pabuli]|uniref:16S rRNA (cytosine(967)-C(5))-methyltransferase n=1 Tax=Lacticaseibacillus pabuli TaxID=3025672 RepID=A0ABY7WX83_9LACO|nr:16S rRNA (cytosine(967)-C(5))-methyltransferase RsmB [Lacticaseibacillus sp. KACC 23028]WDF83679.1 16S rRNA (cytosine(967)-C(5))-methyltransferase RsmB [Lacticaseibacillus sp. KACC 23028]
MENNNPRLLAVQVLSRVAKGSYSNLTLDGTLRKAHLDPRDAGLLTNIVYGVIQRQLTLDFFIAPFIRGKKVDDWVLVLLRTAVYQMKYLDKVPTRAIFYDSTEIAKKLGHAGVAKFVTAILHRMDREGFPKIENIKDPAERLATGSSTPLWLTSKLIKQLGMVQASAILDSIDTAPNGVLRVNRTKTKRDDLAKVLSDRFPDLHDSIVSPVALVTPGGHLAGTDEFRAGEYTLQDESSQLVAPSLRLRPSDKVLDACAAPGGKTTHIAEYLDPAQGGKVTALDLHAHKVKLVAQNAARLGLADRVDAMTLDARKAQDEFAAGSFDRVLVDAPCSGLGLIRRKPEIKYEKTQQDIDNLSRIQKDILGSVADLVKPGGYLTYSTCTMVTEENQGVVTDFLAKHPNYKQVEVAKDAALSLQHSEPALQLFPSDYGTDGFFIASLQRTE